jgi:sec-independent protein translocase protein TatB
MFPEVGAAELLVIAAIALIVVGPKDLPVLMRKVGRFLAQMRSMAAEFRASFDELARQSELDELRREVEAMRAAASQPAGVAAASIGLDKVESEINANLQDPHAEPGEPELPLPAPEPHADTPHADTSADEPSSRQVQPAPEPRA